MKKFITGLILGVMITSVSVGYSVSQIKQAYYNPEIKLRVDGEYVNVTPITAVEEGQVNGFNLLPVRALGEALGYNVNYDTKTKVIDLDKPTVEDVVEKVKSGCVKIYVYDENKNLKGTGSGVIYKDYIITAKHVLDAGVEYGISYDYMDIDWGINTKKRINIKTNADIGLLEAPVTAGKIELGDSDELKIGQDVVSVSSPQGSKNLVYEGKITGMDSFVHTNVKAYPGCSGSGLFDMNGKAIGIIVNSHKDYMDLSNSVPINEVKEILDNLK